MHKLKMLVPQQVKNIYHLVQAVCANVLHGFPSEKIKIIGITGTNGKTTTTQMVAKILEAAGKKTALASTINFKLGEKEWTNVTKYTTLSPFAVQKFIKQAVGAGCEYLVLETSSHSLDQYRVWGVRYRTAVITNVTREHLDYHKTMEKYRKAKATLFEAVARNKGVGVVNLDMEKPEEYLAYGAMRTYGYTTQEPRDLKSGKRNVEIVQAEDIELGIDKAGFKIQGTGFNLNVPGLFNIENALAAICVGLSEGIGLETMKEALAKIKGIPGRLESVENDRGVHVIVDYAVTPDSLEKLYELVKEVKTAADSKIIGVFGSCGERDRGKRPLMGEIVSRNADYVIVTNEDPYFEDPQRIIDEVAAGIKGKKAGENYWQIMDRREAIGKALDLAKPGDVVVVSGKGAEETMAIGAQRIPWNDKRVIEEELQKKA